MRGRRWRVRRWAALGVLLAWSVSAQAQDASLGQWRAPVLEQGRARWEHPGGWVIEADRWQRTSAGIALSGDVRLIGPLPAVVFGPAATLSATQVQVVGSATQPARWVAGRWQLDAPRVAVTLTPASATIAP